ncbi:MAG: hypothetical protein KAJ24_03485 [Candidatus Aenigmarchaeota archaeon]|nr:hypothetical protein [Candidatus Aenigmarchaeota archaeon]
MPGFGISVQEPGEPPIVEVLTPEKLLDQIYLLESEMPSLQRTADEAQRVATNARDLCEQKAGEVQRTEQAATDTALRTDAAEQVLAEAVEAATAARRTYDVLKTSQTPVNPGVLEDAESDCIQKAAEVAPSEAALNTAKDEATAANLATTEAEREADAADAEARQAIVDAETAKRAFDEAELDLAAKQQLAEAAREALAEKQERLELLRQAAENSAGAKVAAEGAQGAAQGAQTAANEAKTAAEGAQTAVGDVNMKVDNLTEKVEEISEKVDRVAAPKRKITIVALF